MCQIHLVRRFDNFMNIILMLVMTHLTLLRHVSGLKKSPTTATNLDVAWFVSVYQDQLVITHFTNCFGRINRFTIDYCFNAYHETSVAFWWHEIELIYKLLFCCHLRSLHKNQNISHGRIWFAIHLFWCENYALIIWLIQRLNH